MIFREMSVDTAYEYWKNSPYRKKKKMNFYRFVVMMKDVGYTIV